MNEEALRALVRETLSRLQARDETGSGHSHPAVQPLAVRDHASHYRYALSGSGGACLIEPGVACTHCGYCQSHGH
jgi:hypothetical protein